MQRLMQNRLTKGARKRFSQKNELDLIEFYETAENMDIFVGRYARFVGFRAIVMVKQSTQKEARMITLTMLSRETGVSRRVLQDYDRLGLLRHRAETPGGY